MDAAGIDRLARALSTLGPRRGLLSLGAAVPLIGALVSPLAGERAIAKRGKKKKRKRKKKRKKRCKKKRLCAGQCGTVKKKKCKPADCGPCACSDLLPTADLQAAIEAASPGSTLTLCAGTWELPGTAVMTKDLTLRGAGAADTVLDGRVAVRVLQVDPGVTVTVQDLTIRHGNADDAVVFGTAGGGILNSGVLTLRGVVVTRNIAERGGGIYNRGPGRLTLQTGSRVTGNTADFGGGIHNQNFLTLEAGSIVGGDRPADANTAAFDGGGIYNFTQFGRILLKTGSRVAGNTADFSGGISNFDGTITLEAGALVCDNVQVGPQCGGDGGTYNGDCPHPVSGVCSG